MIAGRVGDWDPRRRHAGYSEGLFQYILFNPYTVRNAKWIIEVFCLALGCTSATTCPRTSWGGSTAPSPPPHSSTTSPPASTGTRSGIFLAWTAREFYLYSRSVHTNIISPWHFLNFLKSQQSFLAKVFGTGICYFFKTRSFDIWLGFEKAWLGRKGKEGRGGGVEEGENCAYYKNIN